LCPTEGPMILLHYISTIRVVSYRRTYDSITL